jgi:hypothetical protein
MSLDGTDSGENTVSDGVILPEKTTTDSLPDLSDPPEPPGPDDSDKADDESSASESASSSRPKAEIHEYMRIGHLLLEVDNPEFAYAMQRGMDFASKDCAYLNFDGHPEMSMQEMVDKMLNQLDEGLHTGEIDALGHLFDEICYLLLGTTRMQVQFKRRRQVLWE